MQRKRTIEGKEHRSVLPLGLSVFFLSFTEALLGDGQKRSSSPAPVKRKQIHAKLGGCGRRTSVPLGLAACHCAACRARILVLGRHRDTDGGARGAAGFPPRQGRRRASLVRTFSSLSLSLHIGQIAPVGATTTKNNLYPFYRFRASQLYQDDRAKCQRGDRHARGKAPIRHQSI